MRRCYTFKLIQRSNRMSEIQTCQIDIPNVCDRKLVIGIWQVNFETEYRTEHRAEC